jgi:hypothetical protein
MAQWSACAWETAAVYDPEYKNPKSNVPKALFTCGLICLMLYTLTQVSVIGTLGINGIVDAVIGPLNPMAKLYSETRSDNCYGHADMCYTHDNSDLFPKIVQDFVFDEL